MADETLRNNLDRAFDPGPGFPDRLLLSRTMAALRADFPSRRVARNRRFAFLLRPRVLALVAVVVAVAIVAASFAFGLRARLSPPPPTQVKHGKVIPRFHNGQIVLSGGTTLFAVDPDTGAQHPILSVQDDLGSLDLSDPVYSPDGTKLAYLRGPAGGIWILDTTTGLTRQLTTCNVVLCDRFSRSSWSPDGSHLAFSDSDQAGGSQLYVINADGGKRTQLTHFPRNQKATQPSWSPDGTLIAFSLLRSSGSITNPTYGQVIPYASDNVEAVRPDGSQLSVLLADMREQSRNSGPGYPQPVWSPDGSRIAYIVVPPSLSTNGSDFYYQVWLMDPDGSHRQKIFEDHNGCCGPGEGGMAWSPDGSRITVFVGGQGISTTTGTLWVMNADGSDQVSFGHFPSYSHPTWQPVP
jgi:Tol biopolymer transport system component